MHVVALARAPEALFDSLTSDFPTCLLRAVPRIGTDAETTVSRSLARVALALGRSFAGPALRLALAGALASGLTGALASGLTGALASGLTGTLASGLTGAPASGFTGAPAFGFTGALASGLVPAAGRPLARLLVAGLLRTAILAPALLPFAPGFLLLVGIS